MTAPFLFLAFLAVMIPCLCYFSGSLLDDMADRWIERQERRQRERRGY